MKVLMCVQKALEAQLDQKQDEFNHAYDAKCQEVEDVKSKLRNPTDIELMKLKLIEEMETSSRRKWEIVNQEIEKYRQLYFQTKRELEFTSTEMERLVRLIKRILMLER